MFLSLGSCGPGSVLAGALLGFEPHRAIGVSLSLLYLVPALKQGSLLGAELNPSLGISASSQVRLQEDVLGGHSLQAALSQQDEV